MIRASHLFNKLSITPILSDTFAPPRIATNGRTGRLTASSKNLISFSIKNPLTATGAYPYNAIPAVVACALCAVPNASFT